jgi:signal transduction histidine kinase/DNA-binding response OmpR family regulator
MREQLSKLALRYERDVVKARQRARTLASLLGLDPQEQIRVATATSEIARNAFRYAKSGNVEFLVDLEAPQHLVISVDDKGPGIGNLREVLDGQYKSETGMGMGIIGTRRLMDRFDIQTSPRGTTVVMQARLRGTPLKKEQVRKVAEALGRSGPEDPFDEVERQNQELLKTLDDLKARQHELAQVNRELEDTNRGVVALYAELDERADALRRASDLKTSFLSNMSHEFRTPLNSVLSLSRMLLDRMDGDLTAEQEKQVQYIRKSAEDLYEMVNDLLDLAKVEAGKVEVRPKRFTVGELFGTLRGMLKPLLQENSLDLVFEEDPQLPTLFTDDAKLSQVLRNFISNAIKFTQRGEVRVTAADAGDGTVAFAVADTGIGIAPEDQERIFEEFTQIDNPAQHRAKGTGLGLPLARNLARLLGGEVTVTSTLGLGSTFTAVIPVTYPGIRASQQASEPAIPQLQPGKLAVLLVEDNRETAFLIESYFKRSEFGAIAVHSLADARKVLARMRPAAVVLDIVLQGEPCWGFIKELTAADLPVLAVSVSQSAARALAAGADAFLQKPLDAASLVRSLRQLTSRQTGGRILLIDDNEVSRYVLRNLIPEESLEIVEARSGREGLQAALQHKPRVIFLDLAMPDLNGFEVLRELRQDARTRDIPVVIHSSHAIQENERARVDYPRVTIWPKNWLDKEDAPAEMQKLLASLGMELAGEGRHV